MIAPKRRLTEFLIAIVVISGLANAHAQDLEGQDDVLAENGLLIASSGHVSAGRSRAQGSLSIRDRAMGDLDEMLMNDSDVLDLLSVRDEITQRIHMLGIPVSDLKTAYDVGDDDRVISLLSYTDAEMTELSLRLSMAREAILFKFPEIERMVQAYHYEPCQGDCLSLLDNLLKHDTTALSNAKCRVAPYVGCLVGCTFTGPVGYWICSYVCVCAFCQGGWVDTVCGRVF